MRTLADMTPEERQACVGMWCYIFEQLDEPPVAEGIIAGYREDDDGRTLVIIDHPHPDAGKWGHGLTEVVPRPDLSRAWQPDGTPPAWLQVIERRTAPDADAELQEVMGMARDVLKPLAPSIFGRDNN